MYSIPKVTCYTYLGITFDKNLSLKPILSKLLEFNLLINTGILWCIKSSGDLKIPPMPGIYATQQIKCFIKWRKSNCIIRDFVCDIPTMSHYSSTKESKSPYKKLKKNNTENINEIKELLSLDNYPTQQWK
ncbi:hypothetical protein PIROE2DRAFT_15663 [Piromyces sp. E2]|nr:hypothetical protein PIROE2DRAFT_15663 [Piromyces sp. E2]|eukprot:OUM58952.1 hypothetical protein PIROE2DRAFT_15663 [Piromyces sp. E2]